jgi:hypothetical protein
MSFLFAILVVLVYSGAVLCLGSLIWNLLFRPLHALPEISPPARWATAFMLGTGGFSLLWLSLGLLDLFSPRIVAACLAAAALAGFMPAYRLTRQAVPRLYLALADTCRMGLGWTIFSLITLGLLICLGLTSLAGPVVVGSDASAFYMVLPKILAETHGLQPLTDVVTKHSTFGLMGELHYAAGMALRAGTVAKGFAMAAAGSLMILLLCLGSITGLGRRGQIIMLAMALSSSALTNYICDGKVDTFPAAFGIAAAYWALQTGRVPARALLLVGLFLGWAVYAKLSMLIALAPSLTLLILWRNHVQNAHQPWSRPYWAMQSRVLLVLASLGVLLLIPLVLKNWLLMGEPFAPVYWFSKSWGSWFAVRTYTPDEVRRFIYSYPLVMAYGQFFSQGGTISPLLVALAPLAFLLPRPKKWLRSPLFQATISGLAGLLIWVVLFPKGVGPRYILPVLMLMFPLAAKAAENLLGREKQPRFLSAGVWAALFLVPLLYLNEGFVDYYKGPVHFAAKIQDPSYKGRPHIMGPHPVVFSLELLNRRAASGDRVLMGMIYRYWLRTDLLTSLFHNQEWWQFYEQPSPQARWKYIYGKGVRYVMIDSLTHGHLNKTLGIINGIVVWRPKGEGTPPGLEVKRIYHHTRWSIFALSPKNPQ